MSEPDHTLTDEELEKTLGSLGEDDIAEVRKELSGFDVNAETDQSIDELLRETAGDLPEVNVPDIPAAAKELFDARRKEAFEEVAAEEQNLEATVYSRPRRYGDAPEKKGFFARFRLPVGLAATALAAALVVGMFYKGDDPTGDILYADVASLLTPGDVTGFTEPVFTWDVANQGAADIEVIESGSRKVVAALERAYSPLRWSALESSAALESGKGYEVQVKSGGSVLASRSFSIKGAAAAPVPAGNLDDIVKQCEELIADNRPADAWMLWAELNASQKSDPRMQELKEKILQKIG
ncbi:MAG: hypothetical protein MI807_09925 [Verrucomicrobiales bacterium]|nr:hypothetical protein [Verrucomicrobiales bacterium]